MVERGGKIYTLKNWLSIIISPKQHVYVLLWRNSRNNKLQASTFLMLKEMSKKCSIAETFYSYFCIMEKQKILTLYSGKHDEFVNEITR